MTTQQQISVDQKVLEQLSINTIRALAMDGVQKANSGTQVPQWPWHLSHIYFTRAICAITQRIHTG